LGELHVNDINRDRKLLQHLEPHQAYETLGIYMAPDGNSDAQMEKLHSLAIKWADAMRTGHVTKDEAWLAATTTIWWFLSYPLAALHLSKAQ
jgi:hypothetical protein